MIYIWDNGEDYLDHSVWFIESELGSQVVEPILNAAAHPFSRRGGVIAVVDPLAVAWRKFRLDQLEDWFTCYGDDLVDWRGRRVHESVRSLPPEMLRKLSSRLYPSNAEILLEVTNTNAQQDR